MGRRWGEDIHLVALDCSAVDSRDRIAARPAWRARDIKETARVADWLRQNISPVFDTSSATLEETADAFASWAEDRLPRERQRRREGSLGMTSPQ